MAGLPKRRLGRTGLDVTMLGYGAMEIRGAPRGRDVTAATPHRLSAEEHAMPDKTYKLIELVGVSPDSVQQAVRNAITRASESLKGIDWFEVTEIRGVVHSGQVSEFQVKLKVGFRILSEQELKGA